MKRRMPQSASRWFAALVIAMIASCATYRPAPLSPLKSEEEYRSRTLADTGLRRFVESNLGVALHKWPPPEWDLTLLTLVAFYFHPDLDVARARVGVAEAAVITAGARPNPTLAWSPRFTANPSAGVFPWTLGIAFDIPLETMNKRGYRIKQAQALTEAERLALAATFWSVRSRARAALLEHLLAVRQLDLLRAEEAARAEAVALMEQKLAVGEVSRPDVDAASIELTRTKLAVHAAQGQVAEKYTALATALGVPVSALEGARFAWPELDQPPAMPDTLQLQEAGLLNRLDVRRMLAEYAAAEAALQLEVAKQYPDVHLGPGYSWDQGDHRYTLGLAVSLPVLNQNQGPIAEAEARRKQLAAQFLALQASVIGQIEQATARYRAALLELAKAEKLVALLHQQEAAMQHAVQIGESDRLALADIRVQAAVASRAWLDALSKVQAALGALEDAVQRPLVEGR